MLSICKQLFESWNLANIRYCHWKSNEHLLEGLNGETDLDIYVVPDDKATAEELLTQSKLIKFAPQKGCRYPNVDEWIGFDHETGHLIHIHLHYAIITGTKFCKEYILPVHEYVISNRIFIPEYNIYIASPEIEIIILYSRIVLKANNKHKIHLTKSYRKEIDYLKQHVNNEKLKEVVLLLFKKDSQKIYNLIEQKELNSRNWFNLYTIIYNWCAPYRTASRLNVWIRHNYYWYRHLAILFCNKKYNTTFINLKTMPNEGISICFVGQDGCGKSTLSIEINKWLNWKVAAHRFYLGSGEHYRSLLKAMLSRLTANKSKRVEKSKTKRESSVSDISTSKKGNKVRQIAGSLLGSYSLLEVSRSAYKQILIADKYKTKGAIPIFDRFPQNQFKGLYDGPKIRNKYGDSCCLIRHMATKEEQYINRIQQYQPDIVFKLLLSPEESIRRKPFENYDIIKQKSKITPLLKFQESDVYSLDATQDFSNEILCIKRIIWDKLVSKA